MLSCSAHEMGIMQKILKPPAQNCSVHELGTQSVLLFHELCNCDAQFMNWTISQIGRNIYTNHPE